MKKAKKITAALISAVMTIGMTSGLNAFANIPAAYDSEILAEKLEGYTQIEDPSSIEAAEDMLSLKNGVQYYVNEIGKIKIVVLPKNSFTIELPIDVSDEEFEQTIESICPNADFHKDNLYVATKLWQVTAKPYEDLTLEQAKKVYEKFKDKTLNFKYYYGRYALSSPDYYCKLEDSPANSLNDFTLYKGIENKDALQAFIDESNVKCHLELHEALDFIDLVPDTELSYSEEISLAGSIYKATGLRNYHAFSKNLNNPPAFPRNETIIDMHNSVDGDANCDEQLDMSDAVLIMQALANPNKYSISAQGSFNADLGGDGITVGDAHAIQNILLGLE
ncbi:MAG: dockerin type I repeat-containing protein [Ruminococcus sp.]|uniref:dockerin type I repeat-containing protein n=1 Tax=Ruminococcus sp. TaxID=41978 RepID=UPI0025DDD388|nr:dockerin type I repeat-containing protein [Ruminococcus sp.]MBR5681972.1 dockerin type I repeat-containing protein [Ruminococcus sp.]